MLRGVTICILVALAGAALYITKSTWAGGPGEYTLKFPDRDPSTSIRLRPARSTRAIR
jgi:hypothetical protein